MDTSRVGSMVLCDTISSDITKQPCGISGYLYSISLTFTCGVIISTHIVQASPLIGNASISLDFLTVITTVLGYGNVIDDVLGVFNGMPLHDKRGASFEQKAYNHWFVYC